MQNNSPTLVYSIVHWVVAAAALLLTSKLVPGFKVSNFTSALIAAVVIGLANMIIWPILIVLTLPVNILTLGLFTFVVNGAVLKICAAMLSGFEINGWLPAIFGSIVLAIISAILHAFIG